jgi:hypothetical protein
MIRYWMKKPLILLLTILISYAVSAQRRGDIGILAGGTYYLGEINHTRQFQSSKPAGGLFYRHIFDLRYSVRTSILYGTLSGDDIDSPYDYNQRRDHRFSMDILDIGTMLEFNFLPYMSTSRKYLFSPYVTAGFSYMVPLKSDVKGSLSIPFGIGFKFNITERASAGFEWVIRNTFTDEIDGLGDYSEDPVMIQFLNDNNAEFYRQKSLIYRNDMYTYFGITLSYKIAYRRIKCPAYDEPNLYE